MGACWLCNDGESGELNPEIRASTYSSLTGRSAKVVENYYFLNRKQYIKESGT